MPKVTSIHIDSASQASAPLIQDSVSLQRFVKKQVLLPALSEISVSGFTGDDIIELVKARREQAVPGQISSYRQIIYRFGCRDAQSLGVAAGSGGRLEMV